MTNEDTKVRGGIPSMEYDRIHQYISTHFGKAHKCDNENCDSKHPKRYEWALKKGHRYSKYIEDYVQLCPSCHRKYDYKEEYRVKSSLLKKGIPMTHAWIPIMQYNIDGTLIKSYSSITLASIENKISTKSIVNQLKGWSKTSGGFVWKYKKDIT